MHQGSTYFILPSRIQFNTFKISTYILVLIHDVDAARLELAHDGEVRVHGGADQDVVEAVAVDVAGGDGVAEVGSDLVARQVVKVGQVRVVQHNLNSPKKSSYELHLQILRNILC